jgi:hypothetical protein
MIISQSQFDTAGDDLSAPPASSPHIDWFRFAAMPVAAWLTQVMATQKVFEAVRRQAVLTTDMIRLASNVASAEHPDTCGPPNDWPSLLNHGAFPYDT